MKLLKISCFVFALSLLLCLGMETNAGQVKLRIGNYNGKLVYLKTTVVAGTDGILREGESFVLQEGEPDTQVAMIPAIIDGEVHPPDELLPIGSTAKDARILCHAKGDTANFGGKNLVLDHINGSDGIWRSDTGLFYSVSIGKDGGKAQYVLTEVSSIAKSNSALSEPPRSSYDLERIPLPKFSSELQGHNEIRIRNPNGFAVLVGIRAGNKGKNFEVAANGMSSVFIPNGRYEIYFVYSNKPGALFKGDDFSLNNNGVEIQIVKVVGGNYGIRQVK